MAKGYIRGREAAGVHETHHHVMPLKAYLGVFGALLVLTVLTVLVSEANLGAFGLPIAMAVAAIKAAFVIGFFMHLKYDTRFHSFVFFGTLIFIGIFFLLTFADVHTRGMMSKEWDNKTLAHDKGWLTPPEPLLMVPADPAAAPADPAAAPAPAAEGTP